MGRVEGRDDRIPKISKHGYVYAFNNRDSHLIIL